jgi:NADPH:quinone reductase
MVAGLELKSLIASDGIVRLSLENNELPAPAPDEVVIRVEAAPLNPTDHFQMTGPADLATLKQIVFSDRRALTMTVPGEALSSVRLRLDRPRPIGSEGAGTVVDAGSQVRALLNRRVAVNAGGMFAQYRLVKAEQCLVLPEDLSSADGAAAFVNPLTVLGFVETMRLEGHTALVHTAAASNLGQMLLRVCLADGIPLVNVVRKDSQVKLLRGLGATHVIDSSSPDFDAELIEAVRQTGARLAFDAIGGGRLASQLLLAMEAALTDNDTTYRVYGSSVGKKVYIYGGLDRHPTLLERRFGFAWDVGGWLMPNFLARCDAETVSRLKRRVAAELKTTFASTYTRTIGLSEMLDPEIFRAYQARATGEKYLLDPRLG